MNEDRKNRIYDLVKEAKLEEAVSALLDLYSSHSQLINEVYNISFSLSDVKTARKNDVIDYGEYRRERNKIAVRIIDLLKTETTSPANQVKFPLSNIQYADNLARSDRFFDSNSNYKAKLNNLLFDINRQTYITTLIGMPGVGKTFLVNRLGHELLKDGQFKCIWFFNSDSFESIINDFKELARELGIDPGYKDDELIKLVKVHLDRTLGNWLLIFDNACDENSSLGNPDFFARNYFPINLSRKKQVIVTSTNRAWCRLFIGSGFDIEPWSKEDFYEFLNLRGVSNASYNVSFELHDQFGGSPLAIDQAADYIGRSNITLDTFLELLNDNKKRLLDQGLTILDYHKGNIINAIILAYEKLGKVIPSDAQILMGLISFMYPFNIPLLAISRKLSNFVKKNPSFPVLRETPLYNLHDCVPALSKLIQFSLLRKTGEEIFSVHQLIKEGIQFYIREDPVKYAVLQREMLTVFYIAYYPEGYFYQFLSSYMTLMTPHVVSFVENLEEYNTLEKQNLNKLATLYFRLFLYHDSLGGKYNCNKYLLKFQGLVDNNLELKTALEVQTMERILELKSCYPARLEPESQSQEEELNKLRELNHFFSGIESKEWNVVCLNRLGLTMLRNKDIDSSILYFEKAIEFNNEYDFLYGNLGVCYFEKGEVKKAINTLEYSNRLASINNNHYVIGVNKITLGIINILQDRTNDAELVLSDSISIFQRLNEKRFLSYALYPKIIFDLDKGENIQKYYQLFESLANDLKNDLKYELLRKLVKLKVSVEKKELEDVRSQYLEVKRIKDMYKYYLNECLIAYVLLRTSIFFFNSGDEYSGESIHLTEEFKSNMHLFPFSDSFNHYFNQIVG
ncbi:MAG: hypothetical protein DHS20C18_21650 [Saprospiraceae bacterium]|nr:MAG: hypothetical protein DHS20C18_21650 [Saprospiraceae bacterium]